MTGGKSQHKVGSAPNSWALVSLETLLINRRHYCWHCICRFCLQVGKFCVVDASADTWRLVNEACAGRTTSEQAYCVVPRRWLLLANTPIAGEADAVHTCGSQLYYQRKWAGSFCQPWAAVTHSAAGGAEGVAWDVVHADGPPQSEHVARDGACVDKRRTALP